LTILSCLQESLTAALYSLIITTSSLLNQRPLRKSLTLIWPCHSRQAQTPVTQFRRLRVLLRRKVRNLHSHKINLM